MQNHRAVGDSRGALATVTATVADVVSAFIVVRGSDVDAALHHLARMLVAGEDPRFIARWLDALASEDIGMAGLSVVGTVAAAQTVARSACSKPS